MSILHISLLGNKTCKIIHNKSSLKITTASPQEYGGPGNEFSSTDLLAAALGTCIATSIENIIERSNIKLEDTEVIVEKELSLKPKKIKSLSVRIEIPENAGMKTRNKILRAANACLVHKSLSIKPEILVVTNPKSTKSR